MFVPGKPLQPIQCLWVRPGANPRVEHLGREKHSSLLWKSENYGQKGLITFAPGAVFTKLQFLWKLTNRPNKLECLSLASLFSLMYKNTSLLGPFVSCEENDVLLLRLLELIPHNVFGVNLIPFLKAGPFHYSTQILRLY